MSSEDGTFKTVKRPGSGLGLRHQVKVLNLSMRCLLGDVRLWVGDPSTSSCIVSLPRGTHLGRSLFARLRTLTVPRTQMQVVAQAIEAAAKIKEAERIRAVTPRTVN